MNSILQDSFTRIIFQCIRNRTGSRRRSFHSYFQSEDTVFVFIFIQRSIQFIVGNVLFGSTVQVNITFDTTQTPHILAFEISTRTPTVNLQSHYILSIVQDIRDIPFGIRFRALVISEQFPVHPYVIERDNTFTAKYYPTSFPVGRHFEGTSVGADFILCIRHQRRILLEVEHFIIKLIRFVDIDSRAIPLAFPVTGHIDIRPSSCIIRRLIKVLRTVIGILHPMEFPFSVQGHIKRRLFVSARFFNIGSIGVRPYIGMRSEFIQSYRILALPFGQRLFLRRSEGSSQSCQ